LIDLLKTRLSRGERVAVLFPQQRQAFGYATGLREAGIEVENPKELDFTSDRPKLMPYHSAKGLTFDTVFMPRLGKAAFGRVGCERATRVLFVGITRATKWVCISAIGQGGFEPLDRLAFGAMQGCLSIRRQDGKGGVASASTQSSDPDDDLLDLL
jgi:hypothetical protein